MWLLLVPQQTAVMATVVDRPAMDVTATTGYTGGKVKYHIPKGALIVIFIIIIIVIFIAQLIRQNIIYQKCQTPLLTNWQSIDKGSGYFRYSGNRSVNDVRKLTIQKWHKLIASLWYYIYIHVYILYWTSTLAVSGQSINYVLTLAILVK